MFIMVDGQPERKFLTLCDRRLVPDNHRCATESESRVDLIGQKTQRSLNMTFRDTRLLLVNT